MGVLVQSYDIAACHRLKKKRHGKNSNVIVRFIYRKKALLCLKNKSKLKDSPYKETFGNPIYIAENLCPAFKSILGKCNVLRKQGQIADCWSYNGFIHIKKTLILVV